MNFLDKELIKSINNKNISSMKEAVENGANIDLRSSENDSILKYAIFKGFNEGAELLIEKGADIDFQNLNGKNPMFQTIKSRNLKMMDHLIKKGADLSLTDNDKNSLLHYASYKDFPEAMELLLKNGADPNLQNKEGRTPLFKAIESNSLAPMKVLIEAGADMLIVDDNSSSALHLATYRSFKSGVEFLLDKQMSPNIQNAYGKTALFTAVDVKNLEIMKLLIKKGADILKTDKNANSILHYSVLKSFYPGTVFLVEEMKMNLEMKESYGKTPLFKAIDARDLKSIKLLHEHGADLNAKRQANHSLLHYASYKGFPEAAELLIDLGANINAVDTFNKTALFEAIEIKNADVMEILIKKGVDLNIISKDGNSPLHYAIFKNFLKGVKLLIKMGADPNEKNDFGKTALIKAIEQKNLAISKFLIEQGADPFLKNRSGEDILHISKVNGFHKEISKLVSRYERMKAHENPVSPNQIMDKIPRRTVPLTRIGK